MVSDISETLGEEQGRHEVAEEQDRDGEPGGVLGAHSRSTPLTMRARSEKNAPVRITKARSGIVALQISGGPTWTTIEFWTLKRELWKC
jgi:hypothetical protein